MCVLVVIVAVTIRLKTRQWQKDNATTVSQLPTGHSVNDIN